MKWVLLWLALNSNGSVSSGSAEFETQEACLSAQKLQIGLSVKLSMADVGIKSVCVNNRDGKYVDGS